MKSVFQEDSTVLRAIEKAWNTAGRPKEFTVKVVDFGKKGILGFTKKPAIISVSYSPKTQTVQPVQKKELKRENVIPTKIHPTQIQKRGEVPAERRKNAIENQKRKVIPPKLFGWSDEFLSAIRSWLKELFDIIKINVQFDLKINKKILNISLAKSILKTKEEEKAFFIGLSSFDAILKEKAQKKIRWFSYNY